MGVSRLNDEGCKKEAGFPRETAMKIIEDEGGVFWQGILKLCARSAGERG